MNHEEPVTCCGKIVALLGSGGLGVTCGRGADEAAALRHRYPGAPR